MPSTMTKPKIDKPEMTDRSARGWSSIGVVFLVMVTALALRCSGITFDSMWLDEGYQTMVDSIGVKPMELEKLRPEPFIYSLGEPRSTAQVMNNFRQVDPLCPPLYFLCLNRWMTIWGTEDLAVRSLSVLTSFLSMIAIYFGTKKLFGPKAALLTLILQAVSPFEITYAQEARMYAQVVLCSSLSCLSYFILAQSLSTNRSLLTRLALVAIYGVSTWAMINTHYTTLYIVAFQGLYGIAYSIRHRSPTALFHFAAGWALTMALWLPWWDLFRQAASGRGNYYVSRTAGLAWSLKGLIKIPMNWVSFLAGGRIVAYAAPIYATALVLIGTATFISLNGRLRTLLSNTVLSRLKKLSSRNTSREQISSSALTYVWCWALIPALIALAADIAESRKTVEVTRYLMGTAPAIFILAGLGAQRLLSMGGHIRWIVAAHVIFALVNYTYAHVVPQREPWRDMAEVIDSRVPTKDLLLISPHYDMICLNRYLGQPRMQVGTGPLLGNEQVYKVLKGRERFWLLTAQDGGSVSVFVPPEYHQVETVKMKHGLELTYWQQSRR
ncbi:MAG: glycosyltransferase family 39 protein [Candidatus Obscuribacterales bacterium]|nr:glycosyltransferase family 39 protein [Candidatus Obscuribacterales bacterium]